jgi:hypothetical protein
MADELWTELWNKMTLYLPLTATPSDNKTPSYVTTLQNEVTALTTFIKKQEGNTRNTWNMEKQP